MKRLTSSIAVVAVFVSCFAGAASAQSKSGESTENIFSKAQKTKRQDIRRLIEMTGAAKLAGKVIDQILEKFKKRYKDVPPKAWKNIKKKLQEQRQSFVDELVPVYDEHLTHKDIKRMIKFYKTETGQKFVEVLPKVMKKSHKAGRRWSSRVSAKTVQLLRIKGYGKSDQ